MVATPSVTMAPPTAWPIRSVAVAAPRGTGAADRLVARERAAIDNECRRCCRSRWRRRSPMSTITTPDALPPLPPLPPMAWLAMNVLPRTVRVEVPSLWRAPPFASPTKPLGRPPSPPIDRLPVNVLPMIVAVHPSLPFQMAPPLDVIELLLGDGLVAGEQAAPNGEDAVTDHRRWPRREFPTDCRTGRRWLTVSVLPTFRMPPPPLSPTAGRG